MINLNGAKEFVSNHRGWLLPVGIGVVMFGAGFGTGRGLMPDKVVITEKIKEVTKEVVVEKVKTEIQVVKVYVKDKSEKIHRVTTEEKKPDGTMVKTTTEDKNVDTVVHENTNSSEVKYVDREVIKWQEKIVEKTKLVLSKQPEWRVAAGAAISIPYFLGQGERGTPGLHGAVINAELDRKIIGPFWVGVSGNTEGNVGLVLSGIF